MYNQYFGLRENPFSIAPDPQYLYLSQRDREALAHFQYGISVSGGFVQLTGEVGTGKTLLIRALLEELPLDVDVALVLNPVMTVREFVAAICDELRIPYDAAGDSLKTLIDALNVFLLDNHAQGRRTVLIMDEAQNLSPEVLEQVRLLTNLETTKHKLLQIILVGQPELVAKLAAHNMRQLAQRITARYSLKGFGRRETFEYIAHRCTVGGADRALFTRGAMIWVHRLSGGNPRMINVICDRALLGAYARSQALVDTATVRRAAAEVGESVPGRHWWGGILALAGVVLLLTAAGFWWLAEDRPVAVSSYSAPVSRNTEGEPAIAARTIRASLSAQQPMGLATLLSAPDISTDTESAFQALFARWGVPNVSLNGRTGCEVAEEIGLRCIFNTGTWTSLRSFNRPAVIELIDEAGSRHHVLVNRLQGDSLSLILADQSYELPLSAVEPYWFGKFLLLWRPPPLAEQTLRAGMRSDSVAWVRDMLASYQGGGANQPTSDYFDQSLEDEIKAFQRDHYLTTDGIVGQLTLLQLNNYQRDNTPPVLTEPLRAPKG